MPGRLAFTHEHLRRDRTGYKSIAQIFSVVRSYDAKGTHRLSELSPYIDMVNFDSLGCIRQALFYMSVDFTFDKIVDHRYLHINHVYRLLQGLFQTDCFKADFSKFHERSTLLYMFRDNPNNSTLDLMKDSLIKYLTEITIGVTPDPSTVKTVAIGQNDMLRNRANELFESFYQLFRENTKFRIKHHILRYSKPFFLETYIFLYRNLSNHQFIDEQTGVITSFVDLL
jgi:hypothetical protein